MLCRPADNVGMACHQYFEPSHIGVRALYSGGIHSDHGPLVCCQQLASSWRSSQSRAWHILSLRLCLARGIDLCDLRRCL
jgi:hypothetical protein